MTPAKRASLRWAIASLVCLAVARAGEGDVARILALYDAMEDQVEVSANETMARLKNSRIDYVLTALDKQPGAGNASALGMSEPSTANFYYGGFVSIWAGEVHTGNVKPRLAESTDHTGAPCVAVLWQLAGDVLTMNFTLLPNSSALMVEIPGATGAAARSPFLVRLCLYPQSFNREKHGKPRANFLFSSTGSRLEASTDHSFGPGEKWVYFGDAKYAGKAGGAAIGVAPATMEDLKVGLGTYAVDVELFFKPGNPVRCYLVDFGRRELGGVPEGISALLAAEAGRFEAWDTSTRGATKR